MRTMVCLTTLTRWVLHDLCMFSADKIQWTSGEWEAWSGASSAKLVVVKNDRSWGFLDLKESSPASLRFDRGPFKGKYKFPYSLDASRYLARCFLTSVYQPPEVYMVRSMLGIWTSMAPSVTIRVLHLPGWINCQLVAVVLKSLSAGEMHPSTLAEHKN